MSQQARAHNTNLQDHGICHMTFVTHLPLSILSFIYSGPDCWGCRPIFGAALLNIHAAPLIWEPPCTDKASPVGQEEMGFGLKGPFVIIVEFIGYINQSVGRHLLTSIPPFKTIMEWLWVHDLIIVMRHKTKGCAEKKDYYIQLNTITAALWK